MEELGAVAVEVEDQVGLVVEVGVRVVEVGEPASMGSCLVRCMTSSSLCCKDRQIHHWGIHRKSYHRPICSNNS